MSADSVPHCPILPAALPGAPVFLCEREGFRIYREPGVGVDFMWPMPTPEESARLYDDPRYFGGDIVGGYRDYKEQTEPLLPSFESLLARYEEPGVTKEILDVGCGCGFHLEVAQRRGWLCHGVEISDHARGLAAERLGPGAFLVPSVDALPPHRYDMVVMLDVIEHLPDPTALFFRLFSLGAIHEHTVVAIATPNARSNEALRDPAGWVYRHPPYHVIYYSGGGLRAMLERFKFRDIAIEGLFPTEGAAAAPFPDESIAANDAIQSCGGVMAVATGCRFPEFMHERYVPGTWSKITRYEHLPRYALASSLAKDRRVLDFGCGTGYGSASLARVAASVTGCDLDTEALEWARSEHRGEGLTFLRNEDLGASLPAESFDLIVCFEVIEHLTAEQQRAIVANFARLLAPGGRLLTSTPNPQITALYGENPYHLHELPAGAFRELLGTHFQSVRLFDQCLGSGVIFKDLEGVSDSPTTLSLGDEEQRESACWVALCAQENLPPAGNIVVWDWETPFVNTAVAEARESMEAKSRIIALGYQQALTQQTLAEARTRIGELSERAREQGERISLLMRLAAQGANADHAAAPAAVPGLASRVRAAQAWKRRNRVRANMGLPAVTGTRPSFLDLGIAAEAKAPVVHLVLAPAAEVALDRIAAAHAAGPRNLRPEIILAHRCAPVRVEGAAVSALPHDKLDAVFHALVRRRPRFLHLHLDGEELPAWAAEIPAVARLLNIPTLATFGLASPVEPLDGACAVFTEWAGESVSESVKFLPPAWPESEPSPITKTGAPILTWLRGGEEGLAAIVAVGEHASLRIATIEDEVENSRWAECVRSHRLAGRCDPVGPVTREEMERLVRSAAVVVANGDASILARAALRAGVPLVAIGSATALLPARRKTHDLDPAAQLRWVLAHPAEASQQALALWKAGRTAASRTPAAARYGELYRELGAKK